MREISSEKLMQILENDNNEILLDRRYPKKYRKEHIVGAINLPLETLESEYESKIPDKNSLIITSCDSFLCSTSTDCYKKLAELGYKNLFELPGGIADWKANGYETVKK